MTPQQFFKAGYLFDNFYPEQLKSSFNYEEIEKIPDAEIYQLGIFTLSQVLIGLSDEPLETLKQMTDADRKNVLWSWVGILKDTEQIRRVAKLIVNLV